MPPNETIIGSCSCKTLEGVYREYCGISKISNEDGV